MIMKKLVAISAILFLIMDTFCTKEEHVTTNAIFNTWKLDKTKDMGWCGNETPSWQPSHKEIYLHLNLGYSYTKMINNTVVESVTYQIVNDTIIFEYNGTTRTEKFELNDEGELITVFTDGSFTTYSHFIAN